MAIVGSVIGSVIGSDVIAPPYNALAVNFVEIVVDGDFLTVSEIY